MGRILRDVSERTLIVQGKDEVYEVKLISRVGSYYPKRRHK